MEEFDIKVPKLIIIVIIIILVVIIVIEMILVMKCRTPLALSHLTGEYFANMVCRGILETGPRRLCR